MSSLGIVETPSAAPSDRRRELIEAAIAAIAEHGLSSLTLAKVSAGAGLTAASVSFHFKSKEALLQATLQQLSDEFDAALRAAVAEAGDDPAAGLGAVIDVMLDPRVASPARVAVWYAFLSESRARADYQQVCGEKDARYYEIVGGLCAALFADRNGRDVDVEALAEGLAGLLDGQWQDILFRGDGFDRGAARRRCQGYLASICPERFELLGARPAPAAIPDAAPQATLPAWTYQHPEYFELEREHIFLPSWQLVCHANDIPEPGDYETFELLGERAFVVRGRDGRLHAFHNVCRHRAHAVVTGERGRCKRLITCPYHGWAYELDGRLRGVPGADGFPRFDRTEYGLRTVDLEVFMGFVFVRFRSEGPGVAERLAPFAEEISHYRLEEMVAHSERWEERQAVDWKNVMDNYLEDYHFKTGHPGLSELMESDYDREVSPTGASRLSHRMKPGIQSSWSVRHYQKLLPVAEHLPEPLRRRWTYVTLFPGVSFDLFPDQMDFLQVLPLGPGQCLLRSRNYALPDTRREMRAVRYLSDRLNTSIQLEDNKLTASVQGGLRSSSYDGGLLSSYEVVVGGIQRWIREQLPVANLRTPPPAGSLARRNRELVA